MRPDDFKTVRIPVRVVGNQITYFYSGKPLHLKDGASGDLVIDDYAVGPRLRSVLQLESIATMFAAETVLWVNVQPDPHQPIPAEIGELLQRLPEAKPLVPGPFVPVLLLEPLCMLLRGTKLGELQSCLILAPWRGNPHDRLAEVHSLNQAYTRISQFCERHRVSHTGNVFEKVHYLNNMAYLRPLSDRRDQLEAEAEYTIAVLSASWWMEDAEGLPRRWAHLGQMESGAWCVSVVDGESSVYRQEKFPDKDWAIYHLQHAGFYCLPFEPPNQDDWPPAPPYHGCETGGEIMLPWRPALESKRQWQKQSGNG